MLSLTGAHDLSVEMKDVRVPHASRIVRRSFAIRRASVKAASRLQCCGGDWQNTCCGKQRRLGKQKTGGSRSEKKETMNIHSVVCVVKEKLRWMVNDIIEELLNLDMEPKLDSLWWRSLPRRRI